jgi:hypothetical protein
VALRSRRKDHESHLPLAVEAALKKEKKMMKEILNFTGIADCQ